MTILFLVGAHRSGTTPLARALGQHPRVTAMQDTGVSMDEGQHLQDRIPTGEAFGGPGRFAFAAGAHMTETSEYATPEIAQALLDAWTPFWDEARPWKLEKSPPNIIRTRLMHALFPDASFVCLLRHPAITALATQKMAKGVDLEDLVKHWFVVHDIYREDAKVLDAPLVEIRYEDLLARPLPILETVTSFLGLEMEPAIADGLADHDRKYIDRWQAFIRTWRGKRLAKRYEDDAQRYGFSLLDL